MIWDTYQTYLGKIKAKKSTQSGTESSTSNHLLTVIGGPAQYSPIFQTGPTITEP